MHRYGLVLGLIFVGCSGEDDVEVEGDDGGECSDGADNDQDGYFDCQDNGCWASPDCAEGDADTDADADSDTDSDVDADTDADTDSDTDSDTDADTDADPIGDHLTDVSVDFVLTFDVDDTQCGIGVCDCTMHFAGAGTQVAAVGDRVTFEGSYVRESSDCHTELDKGIWFPADETAYHTIYLDDATTLDTWLVHDDLVDTSLSTTPYEDEQWYIYAMNADIDGSNHVDHYEESNDMSSGMLIHNTFTLGVTFNTQ